MSQVLGRAKITVNDVTLRTEKGAKLSIGGIKRTAVPAPSEKRVHFSEDFVEATLECTILLTEDADPDAIHAITNGTINFIGDNGLKYVMSEAFSLNPPEISDDGKAAFTFAGNAAIKR